MATLERHRTRGGLREHAPHGRERRPVPPHRRPTATRAAAGQLLSRKRRTSRKQRNLEAKKTRKQRRTLWEPLQRRSRGSGQGWGKHPSPLKRLPHHRFHLGGFTSFSSSRRRPATSRGLP